MYQIVQRAIAKHKDTYDIENIRDLIDMYLQKQHDPGNQEHLSGTYTFYAKIS